MTKPLMELVTLIHREVCGCDDKTCTIPTEIYDWLYNGDAHNLTAEDIPALVMEWNDYQGKY